MAKLSLEIIRQPFEVADISISAFLDLRFLHPGFELSIRIYWYIDGSTFLDSSSIWIWLRLEIWAAILSVVMMLASGGIIDKELWMAAL